jgi:hypothetical protein
MRHIEQWVSFGFVGLLWIVARSAQAQTTTYSYFYIAGQTSYNNVAPGTPVDVPLYLEEVNSDGSSNSLLANEDGLFAAGTGINLFSSSGGAATAITGISPNSGTPPTGFDDILDQSSTAASAALLEQIEFSDSNGVAAASQGGGVSAVYLGTLVLQASSTPDQTTTFTVGVYDPNNGNTVTFNSGYDLDNNADPLNPAGASTLYSSAASTNFSVTTGASLPEPASISVLVISAYGLFRRRMRKLP